MSQTKESISIKYTPMKQGEYKLYLFSMPADKLWECVKINRREEDKNKGYQRALSTSRVNAISKYVKGGNPIPLSILISLEEKVKINKKNKTLTFPQSEDLGWVIDGQHRLAGMHKSGTKMEIGVIAFIGLNLEEQIQQFVIINREGKGVPTSLYYDLLKKLPKQKSDSELAKERAADIATILKRDEESPFYNRIVVVTAPTRGQLSLTNFVRKVAPIVQPNKGKFELYTEPEQQQIIDNYYQGLKVVFPKDFQSKSPIFFKTIGFGALMNSLPTVFDLALKHYQAFTVKDVVRALKQVDYFDFGAWNNLGTGNAAETMAGEDFKDELKATFDDVDDGTSIRLK